MNDRRLVTVAHPANDNGLKARLEPDSDLLVTEAELQLLETYTADLIACLDSDAVPMGPASNDNRAEEE